MQSNSRFEGCQRNAEGAEATNFNPLLAERESAPGGRLVVEKAAVGGARWTHGIVAAERDQKPAEFGTIFQIHTHHFESSLMRAHEPHHRLHADRAQAGRDFQRGFGTDGKLQFAAQKPAVEA